MPLSLSIADIAERFPDFRVGVVVAENLAIPDTRPASLAHLIREREIAARARWAGHELSRIPGVAAWRAAYKAFGVKQTRYRSSVERLVKNVLAGRDLPQVNGFVDLYNAVSLAHVLPLGADDLDRVVPPLAFRFARDGDSFVDMAAGDQASGDASEAGNGGADGGEADATAEAPKPGEVVYADGDHVLCRRWNWRQDVRSLITPATTHAVVTVQANGAGDLEAAVDDLSNLISHFCRGACRSAIADAARRTIEI